MTNEPTVGSARGSNGTELIEIDLDFASMRQFQAQFSPNLSRDGLFIDTGEPLSPGSVVRFRVILPEEFVFLEGTAVVEWVRPAEALADGVPGMALRFATLSPQNQELVEQLVQDHVDQGGTPFDLDVRPAPADFPTDALEGASAGSEPPAPGEPAGDGFRLTIRGTGPSADEAMQALREAVPAVGDEDGGFDVVDTEPGHGAGKPAEMAAAPASEKSADPPELDWDDGVEPDVAEPARTALDDMLAASSEETPLGFEEQTAGEVETGGEPGDEAPAVEPTFLASPPDFDDGPEILGDVADEEALGGPAFEVSLPEHDDEPDTTPVLPDEGRAEVRVDGDDSMASLRPRRRVNRRLVGIAGLVVLAAAAVLLWPLVGVRLAERDAERSADVRPGGVSESTTEAPGTRQLATETGSDVTAPADQGAAADGEPGVKPAGAVEIGGGADPEDPASEADPATAEPAGPATGGETVDGGPEVEEASTVGSGVAAPTAQPSAPAGAVTEIGVSTRSGGTVVTLEADGSLADGAIALWNLPNPPRIVVRVIGITETYRPYTVDAGTAEVERLRIGLHQERRPPELWVVLDVTDPAVEVVDVTIRGVTAELLVARR